MKYLEILNANEKELSMSELIFAGVHKTIMNIGSNIAEELIDLAKNLKKMRDEKLYEIAGFETFSQYVEGAVGIKERQAYNYINVIERLDAEFLHSNAKLGITKLLELSKIEDKEKFEKVVEITNVEDISVSELRKEIAKLNSDNEEILEKNSELEEQLNDSQAERDRAIDDKEKISEECEQLKKELWQLKQQDKVVEVVKDKDQEKELKEYKKKLKELEIALSEKTKQLAIAEDSIINEYKYKFGQVQNLIIDLKDLIFKANEENKQKLINAFESLKELISVC